MRLRFCATLALLLGSLSLTVPAAWAAPDFGSVTSIDPVVFYTTPGSSCTSQPTNSVTLPTATGTGTISYAIASPPTGVTLSGTTLTGDPATITAQPARTYTYTATDSDDSRTASLRFTLEVVDERVILQTLYNATGGDNWTTKTGWSASLTDLCSPYPNGISVSSAGRVGDLGLSNNNLTGRIPPELGKLTALEVLHLHTNQLSGRIPPEIGQLTSLTTLHLYDNQLSGPIPDLSSLTSLTALRLGYLSVGGNRLSGPLPTKPDPSDPGSRVIALPTSLTTLHLSTNQLSGPIPEFPNSNEHFRLSLYGNPDLYGYPAALDAKTLLRLLAPATARPCVCPPRAAAPTAPSRPWWTSCVSRPAPRNSSSVGSPIPLPPPPLAMPRSIIPPTVPGPTCR